MIALLLCLLLVALLFGGGSVLHLLYLIAVIALVMWLIGFLIRSDGGTWYRW